MKNGRIVIDPEKPLPAELSKEYWETFAKLILEHFFPEKFYDLSVDDEKPDLRNISADIGIEVTSVENEKSREIDSLYIRQYTYGNDAQKEKALKRIKELGGKPKEFFLMHPVVNRDIGKIFTAVKTKTQKLNKDYQVFGENDLFIFDTNIILDAELPEILNNIAINSVGNKSFNNIYIYCFGGDLYKFDILHKKYKHIEKSDKIVQQLAIDARQMLIEKYSDDII